MLDDNTLIGVGLGLILVYILLSLMVSGVQELIATAAHLRAKTLRAGIDNLLGNRYAQQLYDHGLIKGLSRSVGRSSRRPSYIPSRQFAIAVMDNFGLFGAGNGQSLEQLIDANVADNNALAEALKALAQRANQDLERFQDELAGWFDEAMARVSGWYARTAKWLGLAAAVVVVVVVNADTLRIGHELWRNAALRAELAAVAESTASKGSARAAEQVAEQILERLPIGWACAEPRKQGAVCLAQNFGASSIPGWILTVLAVSLGAPFWFDLMGRVARLRGTGTKPQPRPGAPA